MPAFEYLDVPTREEDEAAWLAARRQGVGSSDAPAVCGLSPWGTPLSVFADKVWGVTQERTDTLDMGNLMEDVVARLYERANPGVELAKPKMCRSTARPWQMANIDRETDGGRDVEIKVASIGAGWGGSGTDDVPAHYFVQCQHQMDVRGAEVMDLAALIGGLDYRQYEIRLEPAVVLRVREIEAEFWGRVKAVEQPEPDLAHESTAELMKRLNVPDPRSTIDIDPASPVVQWVELYKVIGQSISDMDKQRKSLRAQIENAMGQCSVASLPNGMIVRRKVVSRKAYSVEATSYLDFRISKGGRDE